MLCPRANLNLLPAHQHVSLQSPEDPLRKKTVASHAVVALYPGKIDAITDANNGE